MTRTRSTALQLFALSFVALFLELMVIRWAPSVVRLVAYFANLMLISSFLGLGIGLLLADRKRRYFPLFPLLVALEIAVLLLSRSVFLPGSGSEQRFWLMETPGLLNYLVLVGVFVSNALVFLPLGQQLGSLFQALPPLRAYAWDLAGSLAGTLAFGFFSLRYFSPVVGMAVVALVVLGLSAGRHRLWQVPVFALVLVVMFLANDRLGIWSPYYYITVHDGNPPPGSNLDPSEYFGQVHSHRSALVSEPRAGLRTDRNPPLYEVSVNQDFYQGELTLDGARYDDPRLGALVSWLRDQYLLPYQVGAGRRRVAVMGAGGGTDVEAALLSGVEHVDAVEIDPVLVELSRRFNASGVYDDPRVSVHVNDARAFLRSARPGYDLIVFGWLDSQALFSHMSNIRLDGYIYTVESMRSAYSLLAEDGVLALSFMCGFDWMAQKLVLMVSEATGQAPIIYLRSGQIVLIAARGAHAKPPDRFGGFERFPSGLAIPGVDVPTDDWPFLYLSRRMIPSDYLTVIGTLLLLSLAAVFSLRGKGFGAADGHFLFLGLGFLLLETTSITNCSLYFGTTWVVTMLVVAGVLLMVLLANVVAMRLRRPSLLLYAPLFGSLLLLHFVPQDWVLSLPFVPRLLWTVLVVPLPVFFAGLIFSTSFRDATSPALLLGANLVGAMIGGFCEYLGMAVGHRSLGVLIMAAYAASLICRVLPWSAPDRAPAGAGSS